MFDHDSWFQLYGSGQSGQNSFDSRNGRLHLGQILSFTNVRISNNCNTYKAPVRVVGQAVFILIIFLSQIQNGR